MNWFIETFRTSIGKKLLMAITGLGFLGFIAMHLMGNLTLFAGRDAFLAYVEALHGLEAFIVVAEIGLLAFAIIHVLMGFTLYLSNNNARKVRYAVQKSGGGRNIGSATMPYTGLVILLFLVLHLNNFSFADVSDDRTIYEVVTATFASLGYVVIYLVAAVALAIHIRHGFWSLFQSLGLNHDKYMPAIRKIGIAFAVVVGAGFALIPIYLNLTV